MSRAIVIVIGVALGLALAALSSGRLGHLRSVAPSLVPGWMAGLDGQSSLWRGRAADLRLAVLPVPGDLSWRFARPGAPGAHWDVMLSGPGLSAEAQLGLPLARDRAEIRAGRAEILLGDWPALIADWPLDGLVTVTGLSADLDVPSGQPRHISAALEWSNARLGEVGLGPGEAVLTSDPGGGWRAPFSTTGEGIAVTGTLSGRLGATLARLDLRIEPSEDMPEGLARTLDASWQVLPDGGWQITREVDLGVDWPLF